MAAEDCVPPAPAEPPTAPEPAAPPPAASAPAAPPAKKPLHVPLLLGLMVVGAVLGQVASACVRNLLREPPPVLHVFLLAGQSNMEGHAVADLDDARDYNGGRGNLVSLLADPAAGARWRMLRDAGGGWTVRDDVFVSYQSANGPKAGPLTVGYAVAEGAHHFGPELGIGWVLGDRCEEPVLLVKTAWGGKSLAVDFRPPGAGGETGPFYAQMLAEYRAAAASAAETFPACAGLEPKLEGVIWFQGWNDGCDAAAAAEYEQNLVHLILDLRAEFGDPALPFVVGETGNMDNEVLRAGQRAGCERPEVAAGTRFVPTFEFRRRAEDSPNVTHGHHWFGNAESYLLAGDAMGRAMAELLDARAAAER